MRHRKQPSAFTLIELMIVVAVIGVLAAIAIANFANLTRKSGEALTKGNIGTIRSALAIYYGDNEGIYPFDDLTSITQNSRYMMAMPMMRTIPHHPDAFGVTTEITVTDSGGWSYDNTETNPTWGGVRVGCTHRDVSGHIWSSF